MDLVEDFERVMAEGEKLESATIPMRLKRRIANAYARAIEKCLVMAWEGADFSDATRMNRTLLRHTERGIREFIP